MSTNGNYLVMARVLTASMALAGVREFPYNRLFNHNGFWYWLEEIGDQLPERLRTLYTRTVDLAVTVLGLEETLQRARQAGLIDIQYCHGIWHEVVDVDVALAVELISEEDLDGWDLDLDTVQGWGVVLKDCLERAEREQREFEAEQRNRNRLRV